MNIDAVIEILDEFKVEGVCGNIIFPSPELTISPAKIRDCASQLGLNITQYWHPNKPMPGIYELPNIGWNQYYLECSSLKMFKEVSTRFREQKQLPPYFIMAPAREGNPLLTFNANHANLKAGRGVSYEYEFCGDLEKFRKNHTTKQ